MDTLQSSMSWNECLLAVYRWVQWPLCRRIAYCFLVRLDQAFKHYNSRAATEWRQMIHKNRVCVWCVIRIVMAGRTFLFCSHSLPDDYKCVCVCVCACVRVSASYPLRGEERWGCKHISSGEMMRTPLLRKEAPKSTVAETIFECEKFWNIYHAMMHDSGSPFVFYIYLHTHM